MPIVRQVFKRTRQISSAIKDVSRLREIVKILLNHGFGYLLENVNIPGMGRIRARRLELNDPMPMSKRALHVITELGPTAVKIGQILSTRPDLIPAEFVVEFETLQDNVAPLSVDDIRSQIRLSLKSAPEDIFEDFDPIPLASASIAQVHRATLKTHEKVVVKVQRPGIRQKIFRDLEILMFLARQIEHSFPEARIFNLIGIVEEIEHSLQSETNFMIEAGNLSRFAQNFKDDQTVHIPVLYREYSTSEVITMEYIDGIKITKAEEAGRDIATIGWRYLDASYRMLFRDGFFHGDLHPGNVILMENDVLGFIDFGMVGRLTPDMKDNVIEALFGLMNMDFHIVAKIFWEIGIKDETVSFSQFEAELMDLMERHFIGKSISEIQMGNYFKEVLQGAVRHRIKVPSGYTMLFKGLVTTEGMAKMLVPDIDPVSVARPYIEQLIKERYSPERLRQDSFFYISSFRRIFYKLPTTISQLMTDLGERRMKFGIDLNLSSNLKIELQRVEDRRIMSYLAIVLILSGTLLIKHGTPLFLGIPPLSIIFYSLSFIIFSLLTMGYPWKN